MLDTNVILHDYNCLKNFQENDIYLPIVVLEELDKFKKGNEQINYNAREFVRELDLITDDSLFTHGAPLGEGLGKLFIITGDSEAPKVHESFPARKPDHQILAVAEFLARKYPKMKNILVTKDVNLRMKARSIGMKWLASTAAGIPSASSRERKNRTPCIMRILPFVVLMIYLFYQIICCQQ